MTGHTTHIATWEVVGLLIAAAILYGAWRFIKAFFKALEKEFFFMLAWRFLSGHHLHGKKVTDATWWEHGSTTRRNAFEQGTWMDRWEHKPRGHRMLWRWAFMLAAGIIIYGLICHRTITLNAMKSLVVYGALVLIFTTEAAIRLRSHKRAIIHPISKSLAPVFHKTVHAVKRMVHIDPENITGDGDIGYIELTDDMTPGAEMQATVERIVDAHMPVESEIDWKLDQLPKIGVIRASLKPPDTVLWADMIAEMKKCAKGTVVLGRDRHKKPYTASLTDLDDPHWGFDVNTKFGKSNFLGITIAQILHQDCMAQACIIDPKRSSLIDFVGSPDLPDRPLLRGVTMANDPRNPEAMWAVIQKATRILERRSLIAAKNRGKKFPCFLLVLDELNQFADIMYDYWAELVAQDKRLPKQDRLGLDGKWPGWAEIMTILRTGRFVNMHVVACSQDFRDDAFGGKGGRNYLGFKGMAGFSPSQYDKFISKKPVPVMQNKSGRWIFSDGTEETWVQVTFADAEFSRAAYDWAAEDRDAFADNDGDPVAESDDSRGLDAALPTDDLDDPLSRHLFNIASVSVSRVEDTSDGDQRMVISGEQEAADYFGWKLTRFQTARRRSKIPGEFRRGKTPCWYEDDLLAWEAARPRSRAGLRAVGSEDDPGSD